MTPLQMEQAVLGAVIVVNTSFHDVAAMLSSEMFTTRVNRRVWDTLRDRILAGEPADLFTLGAACPEIEREVFELTQTHASAANIVAYAKVVRENWRSREATRIGLEMVSDVRNAEEGAVDRAIAALLNLNSTVTECEYTGKQVLKLALDAAQKAYYSDGVLPGITTGLTKLDELTGGLHNGDLFVIGARPAMGKTAFLVNMAEAAARAGKRVGVFTAEQPASQIGVRRMSLLSNVPATAMRSGKIDEEQWTKISNGVVAANERQMWFYDRAAVSIDELVGVARKWRHTHGVEVLYIDYAQRIRHHDTKLPRHERVGDIAVTLKNLARDMQIPVVLLSQVKASVEQATDKRPHAGDLANSDELTREADEIVMLYRDEVYNRDTQDRGIAELLVEKNRHGPDGFLKCAFIGETMRFADLVRDGF